METTVKRSADWLFIIGLPLLIIGYLALMLWVYFMIISVPLYILGAALVAFSRKSRKVKMLIIIPTFLLNTTTLMFLTNFFTKVFS
jgi:hypothetical protein